jgi:aldose 1-epimerase
VSAPSGRQLRLTHADQELVVVEVGGGIRSYAGAERRVLDGYEETEMCSSGRGQLLAPWPNRLGDGCFEWGGRTWQTPLSEPEKHNAIHGLVRWSNWHLQAVGGSGARATYCLHRQPGWPCALDLTVDYGLSDEGLEVTTTVTNADSEPTPLGFGWHPYLSAVVGPTVDGDELTLPAATTYQTDDRGLPTGRTSVDGTQMDFRTGRRIGDSRLDTAFTDLARDGGGRAWIELTGPRSGGSAVAPGARTRMWLGPEYTHLMVYTGDTVGEVARRRQGVAIEPMTCAPDALRSGDGLRTLAPGESLRARWGLVASPG